MSPIATTARNANWQDVLRILQDQRARRHDIVATGGRVRMSGGRLIVEGDTQEITSDGVTMVDGTYDATQVFDEGIAARLDLPQAFLRKLREQGRTDMLDHLVNSRLWGSPDHDIADDGTVTGHAPDSRKHLLRLLRGDPGEHGLARAWLSPRYRYIDSLDVMLAILQGMREAGINAIPTHCDLDDRRWYMRVEAPEIMAVAPNLLRGYRSPFSGPGARRRAGSDEAVAWRSDFDGGLWEQGRRIAESRGLEVGDVVWAGFVASNSDTGNGAKVLAPQIRVLACRNGQTRAERGDRMIHLGGEQSEGLVEWSTATMEAELQLITRQTVDAVKGWLTTQWLEDQVAEIEAVAGTPLHRAKATITEVAKTAGFTQEQADDLLGFFTEGGQGTVAGIAQAASALAQVVEDPALSFRLEEQALPMMEAAAAREGRR